MSGNGDESIIGTTSGSSAAGIAVVLKGAINTDNGNDSIIGIGPILGIRCSTDGIINTGDGNDILTGIGGIEIGSSSGSNSSKGTIKTGNGNDIITGLGGIFNNTLGTIDTGAGNDIVDARDGGFRGFGTTLLGDGNDIVQGFGSGSFDGGRGKDTLELTSGSYTVGISGTTVNFIKGSTIMKTSDFEILIAGNTTYGIPSLINGQIIVIA